MSLSFKLDVLENEFRFRKVIEMVEHSEETYNLLRASNVMMISRMKYNDHGPIHAKIVANNSVKMIELLNYKGIVPSIVKDYGLSLEDAKVIVFLASVFHDVGNAVHRENHPLLSVVLSKGIIEDMLKKVYSRETYVIVLSEIMHAIISHEDLFPQTIEASVVKVSDALDMEEGRARIPYSLGKFSIHQVSALSIKKVTLSEGSLKPIRIEVIMENPAGVFQVDELLLKRINSSLLSDKIELRLNIKGFGNFEVL